MASEGQKLTGIALRIIAQNGDGGSIGRLELLDAVALEVPEGRREERDVRRRLKWVGQLDHFAARYATSIIGKKRGVVWFLTDEGMRLTHDDNGHGRCLSAREIAQNYDKWVSSPKRKVRAVDGGAGQKQEREDASHQEQLRKISDYIKEQDSKTGKWFENFVAALLRGMGYKRVVVVGGPNDGGIDVVAYKDELGAVLPRVKVQVKHNTKGQQIGDDDILRLEKVVHDGEIGVFVTASSFKPKAKRCARESAKHLELVDMGRLVELCVKYWLRTNEEDRGMLPPHILDANKTNEES